jgi:2-C-methyl-D-erythritol 4-phosphate cytidylyltransferase
MNFALIFAGGTGSRMNNTTIPKQFLKLNGKEIIIHTIEHFENHDEIDGIVVVCLKGWIKFLEEIICKNNIKKVKWIVEGGENGQESIYNGLKVLQNNCPKDSIVLIHDGVRPIIDSKLITDNISLVKERGCAITVAQAIETIITVTKDEKVDQISDRSISRLAKAPQSFFLKDILMAHENARAEKKFDFIDSASLMNYYGYEIATVMGGPENIKITTPVDFYIFRAIYEAKENLQIIGI